MICSSEQKLEADRDLTKPEDARNRLWTKRETDRAGEKTPKPIGHPDPVFLPLFKG